MMQSVWKKAAAVAAMCACSAWATGPEVTNVQASQRADDSKLVDIYYDLADGDADLCSVWARVSDDDGASWTVPAQTFTGDVGPDIPPGPGKAIIWDAGADIPGKLGNIKIRVYADDGNGMANMVLVLAGGFPYQNTMPHTYVAGFWIDKYEVTNLRYCEFLNAADPAGDHWDSNMEITKTGTTYAVDMGYQNYPVRWVSWYDTTAFADWVSLRTGSNYRLPTEQEWEKAAAWDPVEEHYYTYGFHSDAIDCSQCNFKPDDYCVGDTTEVGSYPGCSFYGCYDMSGNLWEWTSSPGSGGNRILRGGHWDDSAYNCRCVSRNSRTPSDRNDHIGFRLVLDLE